PRLSPINSSHLLSPPSSPTRRSSDLLAIQLLGGSYARKSLLHRHPLGNGQRILDRASAFEEFHDFMHGSAGLDLVLSGLQLTVIDRKSTRLNSSHVKISYAVFCLKKK